MQDSPELKQSANKDIFTVADELLGSLETRTGIPEMPTGISSLDNIIWGLHRKELLVLGARPSQGKTSLAVNIAWNVAKTGKKVLYLSLEMSAHSVLEKILCNEFNISGWSLRKGNPDSLDLARKSIDKLRSRLIVSPITITDNIGFRIPELDELFGLNGPDVVFIDHLQRISLGGQRNRQEVLADYVQACKTLSMKYNFACVLASQINRQGSTSENAMDFMKGTGEIEEAADTLLQLRWIGRDNFFKDPENTMVDKKEYIVNIIKQRHGPIEGVTLDFDVSHYRFLDRFSSVSRES